MFHDLIEEVSKPRWVLQYLMAYGRFSTLSGVNSTFQSYINSTDFLKLGEKDLMRNSSNVIVKQ